MTVDVYLVGKVTASKDVLNGIASDYIQLRQFYERKGDKCMSDMYDRKFRSIFNALAAEGYYDGVSK